MNNQVTLVSFGKAKKSEAQAVAEKLMLSILQEHLAMGETEFLELVGSVQALVDALNNKSNTYHYEMPREKKFLEAFNGHTLKDFLQNEAFVRKRQLDELKSQLEDQKSQLDQQRRLVDDLTRQLECKRHSDQKLQFVESTPKKHRSSIRSVLSGRKRTKQ